MKVADRHPYLEQQRFIPPALLSSPRFLGRIRINSYGDAIFPHFDREGLCGFEKKNAGYTRFSTGGIKGLWQSNDQNNDNCLILTESAVDALSHAALFPNAQARYRSIGGQVNPQQPILIAAAVSVLPGNSLVIAAMDADAAGRQLTEMVRQAVMISGRTNLTFKPHLPKAEGQDWNDRLRGARQTPFPTALPLTFLP